MGERALIHVGVGISYTDFAFIGFISYFHALEESLSITTGHCDLGHCDSC